MNFYENDASSAAFVIQRASLDVLLINGEVYTSTVVITAEGLKTWSIQTVSELTHELLEDLLQTKPELALIGTGPQMLLLPPELSQLFYEHNIGVECMNTLAAARTYNLLAQEGRHISAIFILQA